MSSSTSIRFLGAAGEVTGSAFLVDAPGVRFLVDYGLFQGGREQYEKNRAPIEFDVHGIDFVLVTHAHLDHCGRLPLLVKRGYRGPIYATSATVDLIAIMLRDSAHIQEKEYLRRVEHPRNARNKNAESESDAILYDTQDVDATMKQVHGWSYGDTMQPHPAVAIRLVDAGHILGSAIAEVRIGTGTETTTIVFSGDLGQPARPLVRDPTPIAHADYLILESTYGNRLHKPQDATLDELVEVLNATLKTKRGNVIVPAFALGRTQELLIILIEATRQGRLHGLNVYVDSPLAMAAMRVTLRHKDLLDADAYRALVEPGASGLPIAIHFIEDVLESKRLNEITDGAVIIAASGMCDGGRIKNHLEHNLARPECAVLFTGFQAAGTLGRKIVDGAPEVRIFGIRTPVRASVHTLGGLSAHADQAALLAWLAYFSAPPKCTFIVHGEADTAQQFAEIVHRRMNWQVNVPTRNETITLLDANSAS